MATNEIGKLSFIGLLDDFQMGELENFVTDIMDEARKDERDIIRDNEVCSHCKVMMGFSFNQCEGKDGS